jgi:hypothetical protein
MQASFSIANFNLSAPQLVAGPYVGVITTFVKAVTFFNQQQFDPMKDLFDPNVILYKVNNGSPVVGIRDVMQYLTTAVLKDKPIFTPVTMILHPPTWPTSVRGVALWGDNDNGKPANLPIKYEFHFRNVEPYLITSLWATPD